MRRPGPRDDGASAVGSVLLKLNSDVSYHRIEAWMESLVLRVRAEVAVPPEPVLHAGAGAGTSGCSRGR
ncbi:hypothetical protein Ct61P_15079 [Colletotrichum tofieldiae]|nr:hypothetical protein Ct61P_15079 [Colletotrichum tofieldiae]